MDGARPHSIDLAGALHQDERVPENFQCSPQREQRQSSKKSDPASQYIG